MHLNGSYYNLSSEKEIICGSANILGKNHQLIQCGA